VKPFLFLDTVVRTAPAMAASSPLGMAEVGGVVANRNGGRDRSIMEMSERTLELHLCPCGIHVRSIFQSANETEFYRSFLKLIRSGGYPDVAINPT